jgi:GDP-D-mannose dehydratase
MQMKELAIKEAEQQRKQAKDQTDAQLKKRQQDIEAMRVVATNEASRQKDVTRLLGETIKGRFEREHNKEVQAKELFADGLKTALHAKVKPTKGD